MDGGVADSRWHGPRNPAQDRRLTPHEIEQLREAGIDVHQLKGGKGASQRDRFRDRDGHIYVKPKSGRGPGEPTGLNIRDF
jgi:hypothetical protein